MPPDTAAPRSCPACGAPGFGRFCSTCGAPLGGAPCAGCGTTLDAGSKFCHRCGLGVGAAAVAPSGVPLGAPGAFAAAGRPAFAGAPVQPTPAGRGSALPWGIAFAALVALGGFALSQNLGKPKGSTLDAPLNALPQASLGEVPVGGGPNAPFAGGLAGGGGGAPDLSRMTPRDIADRLFDRIMRLSSEGKADSVGFFAEMALQNYAGMGAQLDNDLRYDMGRVAEVAGKADIAKAQADTILAKYPTHLLGLVLAGRAAAMRGDAPALADANKRLVAAAQAERAKNLEEYQRHSTDIETALQQAKTP